MNGHPHAKTAIEYWTEAKENAEAWMNWEYQSLDSETWIQCAFEPSFLHHFQYRRKPRTININGHEVPEPFMVKPRIEEIYYIPSVSFGADCCRCQWCNNNYDNARFNAGICHATKEAAIAHAKALLSFTAKGGEA